MNLITERTLVELQSDLIRAIEYSNHKKIEEIVQSEDFRRISQAIGLGAMSPPDFESSNRTVTFGQEREIKAILAAKPVDLAEELYQVLIQNNRGKRTFSVVIAVYNAAEYLPALLRTLEQQEPGLCEYIFIDDCSADESLAILLKWASVRSDAIVIRCSRNQGPAVARNIGLQFATGEWFTVVDSDDLLDKSYFAEVKAFMEAQPGCAMYSSRILRLGSNTGEVEDSHPLGYKYRKGNRVLDLCEEPTNIHLSTGAFLNLRFLVEKELTYDPRVRPTFEDGHLISRYLLARQRLGEVFIGNVATAVYFYRSDAKRTSLVQNGWQQGERFDDQLLFGYLALLREAALLGDIPRWLASTILYDISWFFTEDLETRARTLPLYTQPSLKRRFLNHLDEVFSIIPKNTDPCRPLSRSVRDAWGVKYWNEHPTGNFMQRFFGEEFGEVCFEKEPSVQHGVNPYSWREKMAIRELATGDSWRSNHFKFIVRRISLMVRRAGTLRARIIAKIISRLPLLSDAWLILDRPQGAGDNGEHFMRWMLLNTEHKCYFVLRKDAAGWNRLKNEGFPLLRYGSLKALAAYFHARVIVSSDAIVESRKLAPTYRYGDPGIPFVFLQHGVLYNQNIKNVAGWLNPMDIAMMVTSSQSEKDYVVGSESNYRFSSNEVALTGLARWDRLVTMKEAALPENRQGVVLMPTWFPDGRYERWFELAQELSRDFKLTFVVHPSIEIDDTTCMPEVQFFDMRESDFQNLLVSSDVFITDYSSTLFDAAIAGARVAFYQEGKDGVVPAYPEVDLSPVFSKLSELREWIESDNLGFQFETPFADGGACKRIYEEILARIN